MRLLLAIWSARIAAFICKLAHKNGTNLPGRAALKVCPDLIAQLAGKITGKIIVTSGTNGKTTTNNMLQAALSQTGSRVVCNTRGANLLSGIAAVFALSSSLLGKFEADYACLEVDEASTLRLFRFLQPDYMIITNMFRDQLDRYGEIDKVMEYFQQAVEMCPSVRLIVNGDDPLAAYVGINSKRACSYFGLEGKAGPELDETREGRFCLVCGDVLHYQYYQYGQLGKYECRSCGFRRPDLQYPADHVSLDNGLSFHVGGHLFSVRPTGLYQTYNILAVFSVLSEMGIPTAPFTETLTQFQSRIGRMEEFAFRKPLILNLSKNPIGFNQTISTLLADPRRKEVLVLINDNAQDGQDISWLWDVDFERLADANAETLFYGGIRMYDLALRFKYAGLSPVAAADHTEDCIKTCLASGSEVLYVLTNYTALFDTQAMIKKLYKNYQKGKGK